MEENIIIEINELHDLLIFLKIGRYELPTIDTDSCLSCIFGFFENGLPSSEELLQNKIEEELDWLMSRGGLSDHLDLDADTYFELKNLLKQIFKTIRISLECFGIFKNGQMSYVYKKRIGQNSVILTKRRCR